MELSGRWDVAVLINGSEKADEMKLKHKFLGSAAASGFMLIATLTDPAVFRMITETQAATNVSVNLNLGTFYDRLAPYGSWVSYQDRYVWLPENVSHRWRPYTEGHWAFTRRYGWLWVSDERFGWATYHYGRWGYARDIGWYWVPGRRWAPAWVAWSHGDDDVAWAPLPPGHDNDVNISISFGDIPDYYWQAVPVSAFLSIDLSGHVSRDRDHVRNIIRSGDQQTVRIENNNVVNNVIDVGFVEKHTKKKVVVLEEKSVDNPDAAGKADSTSVAIFNPDVKDETSAKPAKTRKVEEIAKERKVKGAPVLDQNSDLGAPPAAATGTNAQPDATTVVPVVKSKKNKAADTVVPQDAQQPAEPPKTDQQIIDQQNPDQQNADQQTGKKKKKDKGVDTLAPGDTQQNPDQQNPDQQNGKKNKKNGQSGQQGQDKALSVPADGQTAPPDKGKKKKIEQPAGTDANGQPACDPAVADCPPAQQ
jgi:hypothetical protein